MKSLDDEAEKPGPRCSIVQLLDRGDAHLGEARAMIQEALASLDRRPPLGIRSGGGSCPARPSHSRDGDEGHEDPDS